MPRQRATLLEIHPAHPEPRKIRQAVDVIQSGGVVVYPTDTIYGLGADIESKSAIGKLYELRGLDPKKPLSLVCSSLSQASRYAVFDDDCYRFMREVLPGPYTFVLRALREAPRMGEPRRRHVGIRVPAHPVALALTEALGRPLLSTSAIISEEEGPSDPFVLADHYGPDVGLVLEAGLLDGTPSSVVDWTEESPRVVRAGAGDVSNLTDNL